ncbi:M28 family metallopeptidase [Methanoculleus sp.]|uniref:M28 family metallopeptidase n=1 Tax=Methanoculleus sp. TaxID=90427 RepID=UPI0025FD629D|nr:M28 family metallopeptidase [Methanoculleus sp.]
MHFSLLLLAGAAVLLAAAPAGAAGTPGMEYDPAVASMLAEINESELQKTASDLQEIPTRAFGSDGNREAGDYIHRRLADMPGLDVEFQGGELNNVVAMLPGRDNTSDEVVIVGAHYDSRSSDPARAPGVTDNGCGVAIVLELARVMSRHSFDRTVVFGFWNAEEDGRYGSAGYVANVSSPVALYFNYDSGCYDPANRSVLDIVYDERSREAAALLAGHNILYGTNFSLTVNNYHSCASDHVPFQARGFPAVTTHSDGHGPAHTPDDTVDHASFGYAKRNAGLGLSVLAKVAGLRDDAVDPAVPKAPPAG